MNTTAIRLSEHRRVPLSKGDILGFVQYFCSTTERDCYTPAQGLSDLHMAVSNAFVRVDLPENDRPRINDFINALHGVYECVNEQDQNSDIFKVEAEDLNVIAANLDVLRSVIRIQHAELHQYEVSSALLWAKTALCRLSANGWNAGVQLPGLDVA